MASIKKVKINNDSLPPLNAETGSYLLRYRIVSADKNRASHWSPVYSIVPDYTYTSNNFKTVSSSGVISVTWDSVIRNISGNPVGKVPSYDVWVRWDGTNQGEWVFYGSQSSTSISVIVPSSYRYYDSVTQDIETSATPPTKYTVEVYEEINPETRISEFKLYENSSPQTI
jgi:hypothetical protein